MKPRRAGLASDVLPEFCRKRSLVLGCGNVLFGDDGFGPAVVEWLQAHCRARLPDDVYVLDAGTGVRTILFTLALSDEGPEQVIVLDAVDAGREPGEIFDLEIDDLPLCKVDDFSMHQLPTSNLLKELKDRGGVDVRIVCCQVQWIPDCVSPGLSSAVAQAVPAACELILGRMGGP